MLKVRICIPFYLNFDGAKSGLRELKKHGKRIDTWIYEYAGIEWHAEPRRGTYPRGRVRNSLVELTHLAAHRNSFIVGQTETYDFFLFIDSDIIWSIDDAVRLVRHDLDVCGGPYPGHVDETVFQAGYWSEPGVIRQRLSASITEITRVDFIATGFLCIKKTVFENLEYPWFRHPLIAYDGRLEELGEDYGFCMLCNNKYPIYADCGIRLKHLPLPPVDWRF